MEKLNFDHLTKYLSEILSCDAFEFYTDTQNAYIPYMMNDALECYLYFTDIQLTGRYIPDFEEKTTYELTENAARSGIIFRQGDENVFTLWYATCYRKLTCYRYDQIGHFWVKNREHWRRLVYIVGTIRDKYEYIGEAYCNQTELALLPLMEFAPFRMHSPIHASNRWPFIDPLSSVYPDSKRGIDTMEQLAKQAGDLRFLRELSLYRRFPCSLMKNKLYHDMNHPDRIPLYELIFQKVHDAAAPYPERNYGKQHNLHIAQLRSKLCQTLQNQGFSGSYPLFYKESLQILAMEEHPFTILEADDFHFRIQLMESQTALPDQRINAGFFHKKGNRCKITPF